jgi:PKHD-type hydroxylase
MPDLYPTVYPIPPYPAASDPYLKLCSGALLPDQVAYIREIGDEYVAKHGKPGTVGFVERAYRPDKRRCTVGWLHKPADDPRVQPIYDKLGQLIQEANAQFWQYDITGFADALQYLHYHGEGDEGGDHFSWHRDRGDGGDRPQRKLSISVLLSGPDEYEGGELQIFDGEPRTIKLYEPGDVAVFTADVQHRVTPVTKGLRRSIVGWACGPKLR